MANEYTVNQSDLIAVADAIRAKGSTTDALMFPGGFVDAVGAIQAGSGGDEYKYAYQALAQRSISGDWVDDVSEYVGKSAFSHMTCNSIRFKKATKAWDRAFESSNVPTIIFDNRMDLSSTFLIIGSKTKKLVLKNGFSMVGANLFFQAYFLDTLVLGGDFSNLTIANSGLKDNTLIGTGEGYIYVPADLISTYENATNWSVLAGKFRAIEDYPGIDEV